MTRNRDGFVVITAVGLVVIVVALVVVTLRQAEHNGRHGLEKLQVAQTQQLARSMDTRVSQIAGAVQGFVTGWQLGIHDTADAKRLAQLQALSPNARTGFVLVNRAGVITNGTLLNNRAVIGTQLTRQGLDGVLQGTGALLPVGPGLTTPLPTTVLAYPVREKAGPVLGAFLFESEVSSTSAFSAEVSQLRSGRTGEFTFADQNGTVVASSNDTLLGQPVGLPLSHPGLQRSGGKVIVIEAVPSAGWHLVFRQDSAEFDGALTRPLRSALLLILLGAALVAGIVVATLARRLHRAREEQRRLQEINSAREEFISIVSHELRTPVVGLLGFLQTTLDHWDGMGEFERRRSVSRAWASARRLQSLTRDVLDSSTLEAGELGYRFEMLDLRSEASTAVMALQETSPNRSISLTTPDEPAWVNADPDRIQQVLTNLLDNAAKSSPPYAPIEMLVDITDRAVRLTVVDHGPGLSAEERERVFDKFVRGRANHTQGTGLGLYICRHIVEAHDGTIEARSGIGVGASFTVTLPLTEAVAQDGQPAPKQYAV